jgi:hypothetical protein
MPTTAVKIDCGSEKYFTAVVGMLRSHLATNMPTAIMDDDILLKKDVHSRP